MKSFFLAIALSVVSVGNAWSDAPLKIAKLAWQSLSDAERATIQNKYTVELLESEAFGLIIDNQGVDSSTPGNSAGTSLGGAIADASYIDKALRGGNYSAKEHLGVVLLGALVGSALNTAATSRFHFRYAVRLANGDVRYYDEIKSEPFRHPSGVCVTVPVIALIDQNLCGQTGDVLRERYIVKKSLGTTEPPPQRELPTSQPTSHQRESPSASHSASVPAALVKCKVRNLAPIRTSQEKCKLIGGSETE